MTSVCLPESYVGDNVDIQKPIWKHFPCKKCQKSQMYIFLKIDFIHCFTTGENIVSCRCMSALNISGILHGSERGSWFIPLE